MLRQLSIRNVVLIESLDVEFEKGFSVLTGETGAGKSILLDALGLVLGERSDVKLIRQGAEQATVLVEFEYAKNFDDLYLENSIPIQDSLILKRVLHANGRSKAYINDEPVSVNLLKTFGERLIEIHGQHDHLFKVSAQRFLIDQLLPVELKNELAAKYVIFKKAQEALVNFEEELNKNLHQQAFLKMQKEDFAKLKPKENELTVLLTRREQISGFAKIANSISESLQGMTYPRDLAQEISQYQQNLQRANHINLEPLQEIIKSLGIAYIEINESQNALRNLLDHHQDNAHELEVIDSRLSELRAIAKKYGIDPDKLFDVEMEFLEKIQHLSDPEFNRRELEEKLKESKAGYELVAQEVSKKRMEVAKKIEEMIQKELTDLFLPNAKFKIEVTRLPDNKWGAHGFDSVVFEVAMNPGQPFSPLHKSASGGEMARLMLALKVAFVNDLSIGTIIFDEIDQGVSGAVALAIGKRLSKLGKMGQTLAITHSPQVAAKADYHYVVEKKHESNLSKTSVELLSSEERLNELGRMLSGDVITEAAKNAALSLMHGVSV